VNHYIDTIVSLAPICALIFMMTKKKSIPSYKALPLAAMMLYGVKLIYFNDAPNLINATVVKGMLTAWTPIMIIWGAVLLFKTMEYSGGMNTVRAWLNGISSNRVAQLMIIGWAFAFLIEGASGFGTPAALAAPLLVGLGVAPVRAAILCLIMNSVPVSFGAVGTPTWFGFKELNLTPEMILQVGWKSALMHFCAALVIPVIALLFVVSWKEAKRNLLFIYLSIFSCIVPYFLISLFSYEFPTIIAGSIGLIVSVVLAKYKVGLSQEDTPEEIQTEGAQNHGWSVIKAMFPLWGSVSLLILTRIHQLGIKGLLTCSTPIDTTKLGSLGEFSISPSCVLSLKNIFMTQESWSMKALFVPSIIPFFLIVFISLFVYKLDRKTSWIIWKDTFGRMKMPVIALMGALVMVNLLMVGGENACTAIIGRTFADVAGKNWQYCAAYLGAIGSFFAGSNTVSNLTFGGIQYSIAQNLGLNVSTILALQSVGGAMGNMVCINNIVAVCSILGIMSKEGYIIKRTVIPMIIYGIIAAIVSCFL